jgi:2-methylfumaryl-CoA hydratase
MSGSSAKTAAGNFFEDFRIGQEIVHATPRTVTAGDAALYLALYGSRFAVNCAEAAARQLGYPKTPIDDLLAFHIVFGKTVPDVSLNAIANLGYAECRFVAPVYVGDTLSATSRVIGLKQNSSAKTGAVYVRSTGRNQRGETVIEYVRWVMVRKSDLAAAAPEAVVPALSDRVAPEDFVLPAGLKTADFDAAMSGSKHLWEDYSVGERIDHVDGVTIEEADHMMAARLYQNTARVHFNAFTEKDGRFGRRIVYGGHVISLARAISFNGLANAFAIATINGGRHVAPCFAGDTVFAWTEVLECAETANPGVGALRLRTIAAKDRPCADFPGAADDGYDDGVILDLDYWVLMPRRP